MSAITDPRSFQGLTEIHELARERKDIDIARILAKGILDSYSEDELLDLAHATAERENWGTKEFCLEDIEDGETVLCLEESTEQMIRYLTEDSSSLGTLQSFVDKLRTQAREHLRHKITLDYCSQHMTIDRRCYPSELMAIERTLPELNDVPEFVFSAN